MVLHWSSHVCLHELPSNMAATGFCNALWDWSEHTQYYSLMLLSHLYMDCSHGLRTLYTTPQI